MFLITATEESPAIWAGGHKLFDAMAGPNGVAWAFVIGGVLGWLAPTIFGSLLIITVNLVGQTIAVVLVVGFLALLDSIWIAVSA